MRKKIDLKKYKVWLNSTDSYQRGIAVAIIWHMGIRDDEIDQSTARILRTDDQISIRRDAVRMIAGYKDKKFKDVLIEALDDEDWCVRGEAFREIKFLRIKYRKIPRVKQFINEEVHPFCRWCIDH